MIRALTTLAAAFTLTAVARILLTQLNAIIRDGRNYTPG